MVKDILQIHKIIIRLLWLHSVTIKILEQMVATVDTS